MPSLNFERSLGVSPIAGVDEAGRGPLAGPVVAAAVVLDLSKPIPRGINDSKLLTREAREELAEKIRARGAFIGLGSASVEEIDRFNILRAAMMAMARAVEQLSQALGQPPAIAIVDGNTTPPLSCACRTVVDGDAKCTSIAAASIIAKVTRDRMMAELARAHPEYGWAQNAGYGTPEHLEALTKHGRTPHHRITFMPVHNLLIPFEDS